MGLFNKKKKKKSSENLASLADNSSQQQQTTTKTPTHQSILGHPNGVLFYTVRNPWEWVMERIAAEYPNLTFTENSQELPTGKLAASAAAAAAAEAGGGDPPASSRGGRRGGKKKPIIHGNTLRIEVVTSAAAAVTTTTTTNEEQQQQQEEVGIIRYAIHGISEAFDGLEDKDELVRTLQRCRCEHLELSPPSRLINWDATKEECKNLVGNSLPTLLANKKQDDDAADLQQDVVAVLKDPMGGGGTGVFFVKNAIEINDIIEQQRKHAVEDSDFLDKVIAEKGRIPSWGTLNKL